MRFNSTLTCCWAGESGEASSLAGSDSVSEQIVSAYAVLRQLESMTSGRKSGAAYMFSDPTPAHFPWALHPGDFDELFFTHSWACPRAPGKPRFACSPSKMNVARRSQARHARRPSSASKSAPAKYFLSDMLYTLHGKPRLKTMRA